MVCVRGPSSSTGRSFVRGSMANHRKTDLFGAAQPGAQFIQLQVWEMEVAEGALVQGLCVLASTGEPGGDRRLPVAEDPLCRRSIQSFGKPQSAALRPGTGRRFQPVQRGV